MKFIKTRIKYFLVVDEEVKHFRVKNRRGHLPTCESNERSESVKYEREKMK